ncbi:hypothetical protein [Streptomyces scopuliridis]|uniref:hypothetical protein n=1 Tax=Streptomyces scopuliridis TaxID=452529 RepID=UPI0036942E5D
MIFHQSLVRVRAGERADRGGNTVKDWSPGAVSRLAVEHLSVQPNTQNEATDPTRTAVVTGWRVLSEPGTDADIRSDDRIEWDSKTLEVEGEVARWPDPLDGGVHHIEFTMIRATG